MLGSLVIKFVREKRPNLREYTIENTTYNTSRNVLHYDFKNWLAGQQLPDKIQMDKPFELIGNQDRALHSNKEFILNLVEMLQCLNNEYKEFSKYHPNTPVTFLTR